MYIEKQKIMIGVISVICIISFLVGAYFLTNQSQPIDFPSVNTILETDHVTWSPDKKNILVEYSDLQCPAYRQFHTTLKEFEASGSADTDIPKKVTLVYRHYPLTQLHPHAQEAALAAEAAGLQGKFFQFADMAFEKQAVWSKENDVNTIFTQYAKDLGLNVDQFKKDLTSPEVAKKVSDDVQSGNAAQISATPTFFLNGKKLTDITSFDDFKKLLRQLP